MHIDITDSVLHPEKRDRSSADTQARLVDASTLREIVGCPPNLVQLASHLLCAKRIWPSFTARLLRRRTACLRGYCPGLTWIFEL
jgi:hypothetical protein